MRRFAIWLVEPDKSMIGTVCFTVLVVEFREAPFLLFALAVLTIATLVDVLCHWAHRSLAEPYEPTDAEIEAVENRQRSPSVSEDIRAALIAAHKARARP